MGYAGQAGHTGYVGHTGHTGYVGHAGHTGYAGQAGHTGCEDNVVHMGRASYAGSITGKHFGDFLFQGFGSNLILDGSEFNLSGQTGPRSIIFSYTKSGFGSRKKHLDPGSRPLCHAFYDDFQ